MDVHMTCMHVVPTFLIIVPVFSFDQGFWLEVSLSLLVATLNSLEDVGCLLSEGGVPGESVSFASAIMDQHAGVPGQCQHHLWLLDWGFRRHQ